MATTTKTVKTYALNGSLKDFTIPFEYLARKFVTVNLIGATRQELVLNVDFRFSTPTTITTLRGTGWGPADNFDLIEIRRWTSATERLVDFADGSILRAYDLNTAQVQSLHIAEEARDLTADTIGVNNDGHLDARARRIVNVADAVNPGDAVTLRQEQQWGGSALNQANLSAASAAASQASRLASESARDTSILYAGESYTHRVASETAKNASAASASNSEASNQTAYKWANNPENVVVNTGQYSAFHWVQKAIAHVATALGYANAASSSATQAAQKVTDAQAQVSLAAAQATIATNKAAEAAASASQLGGAIGIGDNIQSTTSGAGNWSVVFKGIVQTIGNIFAKRFEAQPYTEATGFANQWSTSAPFMTQEGVLDNTSAYYPIIKGKYGQAGAGHAPSMGVLTNTNGIHALTFQWGNSAGNGPALLQMSKDGAVAQFSGALYSGGTSGIYSGTGGVWDAGNRVWSTGNFNPAYKLGGTGGVTTMGNNNAVCGVNYQNLSAANQVYNGAFEVRENGLVGNGGAAPGHIYNAPAIAFHWGATVVSKLMMNSAGALCWGNPASQYMQISPDGNIFGSVYGNQWATTYIYNTANERANAWAIQESRNVNNIGIAMSSLRVNSLGCHMLCLAHNNSGVEWNEGVAGSNLTGTNTGGTYFAGYTLAGSYVRMGKLVNADGASPDSVTLYMRYA